MSSDRAKQIALLLQAIIDKDREKADWTRQWKEEREQLVREVDILRANILSGQMELPTDPVDLAALREIEHAASAQDQ